MWGRSRTFETGSLIATMCTTFDFFFSSLPGKAFDISYIRVKFQSPRPESFAIYKRTSESEPWVPYQFYRFVQRPLDGSKNGTRNGTEPWNSHQTNRIILIVDDSSREFSFALLIDGLTFKLTC